MSANQINVRRKDKTKKSRLKIYLLTGLIVIAALGVAAFAFLFSFSDRLNFVSANLETVANGKNKIIRVARGGNVQAAINSANGGDIIELEAGAAFYGNFVLPKKAITEFITIRSSAANQLPENLRVSPSQSKLMAKLATKSGSKPLIYTEAGAHHFRFVGIEFASESPDYVYNLVWFGDENEGKAVPHHLEIDRSYLHSGNKATTRRGIALNSADTIIQNSYIEGFAFEGEETQGICGWTGTKNAKILNNYIEGGAENIMFGGAEPASPDLIPIDIEVSGNRLNKPAKWKGKAAMKTLFELKNAINVRFTKNYLENNWIGSAFRITVRNETGKAPFSTIENVVIQDNIINGAGEGVQILGTDNNYPSRVMKDLKIVNNLFLNLGGDGFDGSGYFILISNGEGVLIENNTSFNTGNIVTFYGVMPKNFLFRHNIVGHGNYGIHGHPNIYGSDGQKLFQNNVIVNNRKVPKDDTAFPPNNVFLPDFRDVGFTNLNGNDFTLAPTSRFKGKGANKTDIGSDVKRLPLENL